MKMECKEMDKKTDWTQLPWHGKGILSVGEIWTHNPPIGAIRLTTKPPANDSLIKNIKEYNIKLMFADLKSQFK